jgi:hypothetical protein
MHDIRSTLNSLENAPATPIARKSKPKRAADGLGALTKIAIKREEARVTDSRSEDRHRNVVEECVVHIRRKKHNVRVVNVSSRGAMIECDILPRIGETLDIQFTDQNRTRCVVRWVREGRIGLEFVEETIFWEGAGSAAPVFRYEAEQPKAEAPRPREVHQREHRQKLLRVGTLYWSGISIPVRLRNISAGGARVESGRELCPGSEVELDLGEAGFQMAEVRWSKDGQVGLRFAEEFDLDSLAAAPAAAEASPEMLKPAYLETETRPDSPWAARFERLSMTDLKIINPEP